ncbi:MAG: ABC transporter permease, partial [Bifidobacteriaceae bacterium]|nr:ABC transporter permease [Bifidobacteriaceae bacterium]
VAALGGERGLNETVAAHMRAERHLDQPFLVQYFYYIKGIFTLDLGTDLRGRPVMDVVVGVYPVTVKLALMALVIETVLGVATGLAAGLRKGKLFDSTFLLISLVVIAVPTFVVGFVLQFFIGVKLGWLPPTAGQSPGLKSLLMPACALAAVSYAYVLRLTRVSVFETSTADFVRTATAKGLTRGRVVTRHILRNSLIPVVTFLGADLGALMAGAVVTETVFNVHGVGYTLFESIQKNDPSLVVSLVTVLVLVYILSNLMVDLLYAALDPRIRYD